MTSPTWIEIQKRRLNGDPQVFVPAAKSFIEAAFLALLQKRGFGAGAGATAATAVEQNFELLPDAFQTKKTAILELLRELAAMDRQVNWYDGDFIDHAAIAARQDANFDIVLDLLKPKA